MSDRDRQNPYERSQQHGGNYRDEDYASPRQANQWQSESHRQQGSDWQQDAGRRDQGRDNESYGRDYRFSGQGEDQGRGMSRERNDRYAGDSYGNQGYGRYRERSSGGSYGSQYDDGMRGDRGYGAGRGYGQSDYQGRGDWSSQRGWRDQDRSQRSNRGVRETAYETRDYDASGGNDFGNFTSEDYGGRDFYNRGGGAMGGMRSSESYRPSYGLSSWMRGDDDSDGRMGRSMRSDRGGRGREDYGSWREYGEERGFFAKAGDEIASWFGDEDASRRRDRDHRRDEMQDSRDNAQSHRGRGPSNYTRSDDRIREDANDHLTHDHAVDATHISVSVKDGELTLDGTVESRQAKRHAEDCVEHISGVKHVQNNLRVQERTSGSNSSTSPSSEAAGSSRSTSATTGQAGTSAAGSTGATSGTSASDTSGSAKTTSTGSSGIGSASTNNTGTGSTTARQGEKTS